MSKSYEEKRIDSNGNIIVEEQYQNDQKDNEMSYVGKWKFL